MTVHPAFADRLETILATGDHCPDCGAATQPVRAGQVVQCVDCDPTALVLRKRRADDLQDALRSTASWRHAR